MTSAISARVVTDAINNILNQLEMRNFMLLSTAIFMISSCNNRVHETELKEILSKTEQAIRPLQKEANLAYWEGTTNGDPEAFKRYSELSFEITKVLSNKDVFQRLKNIKEGGEIKDSLLNRELELLYNSFLANQSDTTLLNDIIKRSSSLEQKYSEYRAMFKGRKITDNEVEKILQTSVNSSELEEVWRAHKAIGEYVSGEIIEVVKQRNRLAKSIGFENYHTMTLELSGQNPNELLAIFDELDSLTSDSFAKLKEQIDSALAIRYKIRKERLQPWHYQGRYFQEAPNLYPVDFDQYYKGKNLEELTATFYKSIGMDIYAIMKSSDLYERPGKNQHAYCTDIDSEGDVRALCNISDNEKWMDTMLHEFGHGVYSMGHDVPSLPYFLRNAAHPFTTEAVAMIFGRLSRNPEWMQKSLGLSDKERDAIADNCNRSSRLQQLVASRWMQVMYRFEKEMYSNPDQDLNKLWWTLVEKYQMMKKPEGRDAPDWASKIHIAIYPCYYHNYQLGEILASQMHYYIVNNISKSGDFKNECYIGNKDIGNWMITKIFNTGMRYHWNEMIERATGEKLTAKYFAMQFID